MSKISVNLPENQYEVVIGKNTLKSLPAYLNSEFKLNRLFFVIDSKMYKRNSGKVDTILSKAENRGDKIFLTATEKNKTYESLIRIHRRMIKSGCGRDCIVIALGGGIIGDVAGFAAATYMRGVRYVQVPTTLLSMVDSSVGGKTGINLDTTKNIIGAFHQPQRVFCDLEFLQTLDKEELICGMGEIAKYTFLTNEKFYSYVYRNFDKVLELNNAVLNRVVHESINFKKSVVEKDEKESGLRKVLNLGHTFAHAIESVYNHKIKHGQAVVVGITMSLYLSAELGVLKGSKSYEYFRLLEKFKPYVNLSNLNSTGMYKMMKRDKKNRQNEIRFVLFNDFGKLLLDVKAGKKQVMLAVKKGLEFFA